MTCQPSDRPVSALRARMIEDMRVRGFSEKTRNDYIRNVGALAAFLGRSPRHSDGRGFASLSAASGTDRRAAAEHQ